MHRKKENERWLQAAHHEIENEAANNGRHDGSEERRLPNPLPYCDDCADRKRQRGTADERNKCDVEQTGGGKFLEVAAELNRAVPAIDNDPSNNRSEQRE